MTTTRTRIGSRWAALLQGAVFMVLGAAVAYLGSLREVSQLNLDEVVGPLLFWFAALLLLFSFPLRDAAATAYRALRTRAGASVFWPYITLHLFLYGFLLEAILAGAYGVTLVLSPSVSLTTDAFTPPSLANTILDLSYSPSTQFTIPPALSGALSLYGVSLAVVISVLVLANVSKVRELGRLTTGGQRTTTYFILPAVGVIFGASCCLSIPALVAVTFPKVANNHSFDWVYSAAYFLFPAFAGVVLYVNLLSVDKISAFLKSGKSGSPGAKL